MTTVQLTLPDDLAREATEAGWLDTPAMEAILRDRLRAVRLGWLDRFPGLRRHDGWEINAEIAAYRAETRRSSKTNRVARDCQRPTLPRNAEVRGNTQSTGLPVRVAENRGCRHAPA